MGKPKSMFSTKADAEAAWKGATKMSGILEIALRELVVGRVKWIDGEVPRRIGLCALGQPHGGVVILVERYMIGARYLEDWLHDIQTTPAPKARDYMPEYKMWLDLRRLAAQAADEMGKANQRAAAETQGCQRVGPAQVIDQDVRQY